jgi:tetratricopeptide (TPR) repeat protein
LGACVTGELPPEASLAAFDAGCEAADKDSSRLGRIEVLLARASFLIAVESYQEAFENLREVLEAVDAALPELGQLEAHRFWASAHRRKAEAWLQLGDYGRASDELGVAVTAIREFADDPELARERKRIEVLAAENDTWLRPSKWLAGVPFHLVEGPGGSSVQFQAVLGLAEHARRLQHWDEALDHLRDAYRQNYGDERRVAAVQYRTARLLLDRGKDGAAGEQERLGRVAVGYASDAVRIFHKMKNLVGVVRAEALLVRALRLADRKDAARELSDQLQDKLLAFGRADPAREALQARVWRCNAEVLMDDAEYERAAELFSRAIGVHRAAGDWHSVGDMLMSLAAAQARAGHSQLAQESLDEAEARYTQGLDFRALEKVTRARGALSRRTRTNPLRVPQRISS